MPAISPLPAAQPPLTSTIVICTRDRPSEFRRAIASVLHAAYGSHRVLVVDQSKGPETAAIVHALSAGEPQLRYVRSDRTGLSVARNLAMSEVDSELVLFTDDDCEVAFDWAENMIAPFSVDAAVGLAFGNVVPAPCDPRDGFIVGYIVRTDARLTGRVAKCRDGGIGANMAVRTSVVRALGGFDEVLGAGGYFPSCEDWDFAYRVLKGGYAIRQIANSSVLHHGIRDWAAGATLPRQTYMSIGAAYFKHVRCGDIVALVVLAQQFALSLWEIVRNVAKRRSPVGLGRLVYLGWGIVRSYEKKVDRQSGRYTRGGVQD